MSAITSPPTGFENAAAPAFDAFAARDRGDAAPSIVRPPGDRFAPQPSPVLPSPGGSDGGLFGGFGSGDASGGVSGLFGGFASAIASLVAQFASLTGATTAPAAAGAGGSDAPSSPQQYFADATADSLGDPHESFSATGPNGASVSQKWDSMTSHADLLDSDSFRGGYRVSTDATAPAANGVTYNREATVSTHDGRTQVSMRGDGSYAVSSHGHDVALEQGKTVDLGGGEKVTLNADKSLTVVDANRSGGTIGTTLRSNGSGVDVSSTAHDVDLGGYLVNRTDAAAPAPQDAGYGPAGYAPAAPAGYAPTAPASWQSGLASVNDPSRARAPGYDASTLDGGTAGIEFA